jgi:hypothetical protein
MVAHVKTTVEISDALFERARDAAQRDGTTLRALVEEGLRSALERREARSVYRWPDLSVGGEGLQPGLEEGDWARVRDLVYEGRGA